MTILSGFVQAARDLFGSPSGAVTPGALTTPQRSDTTAMYALLRALALNTRPYADLSDVLRDYNLDPGAMAGLRNPTNAVCQFYRATLWPGTIREDDTQSALPLGFAADAAREEPVRGAIHAVWRQSNWSRRKQDVAYDLPLVGEQVLKVVGDAVTGRAWLQVIQPDFLTEIDTDSRGFPVYVRIDVPLTLADGAAWHTEVWDKGENRYRAWRAQRGGPTAAVGELGNPDEDSDLTALYNEDFVPFVVAPFATTSASSRGVPAVLHALDKILYGDALVTALHNRLVNHNLPDMFLTSNLWDPESGMLIPPPRLGDAGEIAVNGRAVWAAPSGWHFESSVPQLDYANHLAAITAHYQALKNTDLPELAWYDVSEAGNDVSGRALQYKLTPAKARVDEARGNAEDALIRATQMAMTVAQNLNNPDFSASKIGTYEAGDFDFWIEDREIVPETPDERSQRDSERVARVAQWAQTTTIAAAMKLEGYTDDEIATATDMSATVTP